MGKNITLTHRENVSFIAKLVEYALFAFFGLILFIAGFLIVTKDARPGDGLYFYKIRVEEGVLSLVRGTSFESTLQKLILGRRIEERKP